MKRLFASTALLLAITFASKLVGFVRELVLLEQVGIGTELDIFVVMYGLVMVLSAALGICIVTSLTPIAGQYRSKAETRALLGEGMGTGLLAGAFALAACVLYVATTGGGGTAWLTALIVPAVVPFALVAEYQVALFLSRGQRTPVIAGNLIISIPLVIALLVFDLGIPAYAAGLAASFALRAAIFAWLLLRDAPEAESAALVPASLFGARLGRTLAGGSAMLAVSAIAVAAQMGAREIAEGQATIIAYGLKVPQFIITSIWFVLGTKFFADLVTRGTGQGKRQVLGYTALNAGIMLAGFAALAILDRTPGFAALAGSSEIALVIAASAPFMALIVFTPLVEMTQRLLVTAGRHMAVIGVTLAILGGGFAALAVAVGMGDLDLLAWTPAIAGAAGAAVCAILLIGTPLQTENDKERLPDAAL